MAADSGASGAVTLAADASDAVGEQRNHTNSAPDSAIGETNSPSVAAESMSAQGGHDVTISDAGHREVVSAAAAVSVGAGEVSRMPELYLY